MVQYSAGSPRDVFLSYAGEDSAGIAEPIARALNRRGVSVWFAPVELADGQSLTDSVGAAIASAGRVVLVMSPTYLQKGWPSAELRTAVALDARRRQRRILPLIVGMWDLEQEAPMLVDTVHSVWDGDADGYAARLAAFFDRHPETWFTARHPDEWVGDVWIRLTPGPEAADGPRQVSIIWGPHVLETMVDVQGPTSLLHRKQFPGVTPLLVRVDPPAIVTVGHGVAPDPAPHRIDRSWDELKDVTPSV